MSLQTLCSTTRTYVVHTNLKFDIASLFGSVEIKDWIPKKVRGKKFDTSSIPHGSILAVKYKSGIRGNPKTTKNAFPNAISIEMYAGKRINYKLYCDGTVQVTGCKSEEQAIACITPLCKYAILSDEKVEMVVTPVMYNVRFSAGYKIDRHKLAKYCSTIANVTSIYHSDQGASTGANIKFPTPPIESLQVTSYTLGERTTKKTLLYGDYLTTRSKKYRQKVLKKTRYNTFLAFQSGVITMSGVNEVFMEDAFERLRTILVENRNSIEEVIVPLKNELYDHVRIADSSTRETCAL